MAGTRWEPNLLPARPGRGRLGRSPTSPALARCAAGTISRMHLRRAPAHWALGYRRGGRGGGARRGPAPPPPRRGGGGRAAAPPATPAEAPTPRTPTP